MKKRVLSFVLAVCMVFTIVSYGICAVSAESAESYEYAWFPCPTMNISQIAYETFSHDDQNGIDNAYTGNVYAPFTGKIVSYQSGDFSYWGYVVFQSKNKVYYADGTLDYMTVCFMHDNDISDLYYGKEVKQGEVLCQTGTAGYATGTHAHISANRGLILTENGHPGSWGDGDVYAFNAFYINPNLTTNILNQGKLVSGNSITKGGYSNWNGLWKDLPTGYLSQCTSYGSYNLVQTKNATTLKTLPCSKATDPNSEDIETLPIGTKLLVTGIYKNTENNYWYRVKTNKTTGTNYGENCYLYSGDTNLIEQYTGGKISGAVAPSTLNVGARFTIEGIVSTDYTELNKVCARIKKNGTTLYEGYAFCSSSYSLKNSAIDMELLFNELSTGVYEYEVYIAEKNYYSTNGTTLNNTTLWPSVYSKTFTVGGAPLNTYTVSYNANGGSGAPASQTKTQGTALTLSWTEPTRTGYTFMGWATSSTATSAVYSEGGSYTTDASVTLYAVWRANTYAVKYNANGGSGTMSNSSHIYGTAKALTANAFTKTGYTFLGWSTSSTATTATYTDKQSVSNLTSTDGGSVSLYAVWKANTYTVHYDPNCDQFLGNMSDSTHTYEIPKALTANAFTRYGYHVAGWSTSSTATTATYTDKQSVSNLTSTNGATVILYAVWKPNSFTIHYDANGGSGTMSDSTHTYGTSKALNANVFYKGYYTFVGWSSSPSTEPSDPYIYPDKCNWVQIASTKDNVVQTLYAIWEPTTHYTVHYHANGGSGTMSDSIHPVNTFSEMSENEFVRTGYTFVGWNSNPNCDPNDPNIVAPGDVLSNSGYYNVLDLYAIWKANTYTVRYNANNGSGAPASQTKTHGTALTLSSTKPTRTGYSFQGWATSSSATTATYAAGGSYTADADATLYAVWKANTYTVKYDANGGSGTMSNSSHTYGSAKALTANAFTKTGYTFLGWSTSSSATTATYTDKQFVSNLTSTSGGMVTLYAVWKANTYTVKYDANGGSGTMSNSSHTYGSAKALTANAFTKTGYTFLGWSTSSSATTATYTDKQSVNNLTSTSGGTVTLYAVWKESHVHAYNKQVASETYLASAATCTEAARYYYSCECGEKGTMTFTSGNPLGHDYHDGTCTRCHAADPDYNATGAKVKVGTVRGNPGKTVQLPIKLANNPGVATIGFEVSYDTTAFRLTGISNGTIFVESEIDGMISRTPFMFSAFNGKADKMGDGTLVILEFEVLDTAAEGDYTISLSNVEAANIDEQLVPFTAVSGKIQVTEVEPGDINDDGVVSRLDLTRLAKYYAGYDVEINEAAADVNGDGVVSRLDLTRLAKYFAGYDVKLGEQ